MAKDLANIRIYGDTDSAVWIGAVGVTFPTGLAAPTTGWTELGWLSEDGVNVGTEQDSSAYNAWQGGKVVRRRITSSEDTFTFQALEENEAVMGLYLPGMVLDTVTGVTTITPQDGYSADERAFILDFFDGDVQKRYNVARGEVFERGEIPHQNTDMTMYEFTAVMYEYTIVTDNPAIVE